MKLKGQTIVCYTVVLPLAKEQIMDNGPFNPKNKDVNANLAAVNWYVDFFNGFGPLARYEDITTYHVAGNNGERMTINDPTTIIGYVRGMSNSSVTIDLYDASVFDDLDKYEVWVDFYNTGDKTTLPIDIIALKLKDEYDTFTPKKDINTFDVISNSAGYTSLDELPEIGDKKLVYVFNDSNGIFCNILWDGTKYIEADTGIEINQWYKDTVSAWKLTKNLGLCDDSERSKHKAIKKLINVLDNAAKADAIEEDNIGSFV